MSSAHSPLRYPGGKNCIFPFVANLISENQMLGCRYIEPYAGGGGLALRLLFEEYASSIVINDLDPLVYSFWTTCLERSDDLINWIERTPINISVWQNCREVIKNQTKASVFERATAFFFLNRTNVSGVLSGGVIGGLNQKGKYKIDARFNKGQLINKIRKIARFANRIEVSQIDGIQLVKRFKNRTARTFIYLDPPYFEKGCNLYLNAYNAEDHARLCRFVSTLSTPWILSYDNHSFIINLYKEFRKRAYKLQHSTSNKIGDEVIIFSNQISFEKSLQLLGGPSQREQAANF
jgi:DNA adenine methylase